MPSPRVQPDRAETSRRRRVDRAARFGLVVAFVAVVGCLALVSCGRVITVGSPASSAPPTAPGQTAPAPETPSSPQEVPSASGSGTASGSVRVVDGTAKDNGQTGNGGTVIGIQDQRKPPRWVQLSAVRSPDLKGAHLINVNQAALYRFDDDNDPSASSCNGGCAKKWPPVTIEEGGNIYLAGVQASETGAIRREDGTVQLTVGGHPIYRFSKDDEPGDLKGQGVDDTWFAVGPKGEKIS